MKNKPTTHFIGIGHGGRFIVEYFKNAGIEGKFSAVYYPYNMDGEPYQSSEGINQVSFMPPAHKITYRDGVEIYRLPDWQQQPEITPEIVSLFHKKEAIVLLADLGDYTGVRLTEALTEWLHQERFSFRTLALYKSFYHTSPYDEEGTAAKERLSRFPEFSCLNPREMPGVTGQTPFQEWVEMHNNELLRIFKEGAQ